MALPRNWSLCDIVGLGWDKTDMQYIPFNIHPDYVVFCFVLLFWLTLQWCHNECHGISNQRHLIVYSTACSDVDQRKHQSSTSLAFARGIHQWPVESLHKGPVTWKRFPFDDVIMISVWVYGYVNHIYPYVPTSLNQILFERKYPIN